MSGKALTFWTVHGGIVLTWREPVRYRSTLPAAPGGLLPTSSLLFGLHRYFHRNCARTGQVSRLRQPQRQQQQGARIRSLEFVR